jgi:spore germination cell wall hydrolase CwlJ-like protein
MPITEQGDGSMKTLMLILTLLSSPAAVMSGQTSARSAPAPATPPQVEADSIVSNPFTLLSQPSSLLSETAALLHDQESVHCLARTVYFEARGEPVAGQMAVASVVLARVASDEFPDTICEVVTEARKPGKFRCQFTWWCDGRTDEPKNEEEYRRALGVAMFALLLGPQPGGPTHFHAADLQPQWEMNQVATIGGHVFYN